MFLNDVLYHTVVSLYSKHIANPWGGTSNHQKWSDFAEKLCYYVGLSLEWTWEVDREFESGPTARLDIFDIFESGT
jgi:hypothetical protein